MIDTDILSEFLKKKNPTVVQKAAGYLRQYQQFAISAITRYEVMRGLKEKNAVRQLKKFAEFCQNAEVYPITNDVLDRTSDLWVEAPKANILAGILTSLSRQPPSNMAGFSSPGIPITSPGFLA